MTKTWTIGRGYLRSVHVAESLIKWSPASTGAFFVWSYSRCCKGRRAPSLFLLRATETSVPAIQHSGCWCQPHALLLPTQRQQPESEPVPALSWFCVGKSSSL